MKRSMIVAAAAGLLACAGVCTARMDDPAPGAKASPAAKKPARLKVGDPAPALTIEKWVKGDAVPAFEKGKVYVVEFWATWCGPCNASMPHLTKLQKEYGPKVTVIGVASPGWNDTLEKVESHVKEKGAVMGYTVAWDRADEDPKADEKKPEKKADDKKAPGKPEDPADDMDLDEGEARDAVTNTAYMRAARQTGIPASFVVDQKGNVAFIGHPMELDMVLEDVVAGKWDYTAGPERLARMDRDRQAVFDAYENDPKDAIDLIKKFEADYPKAAPQVAQVKFFALLRAGRYEDAYAAGGPLVDSLLADASRESAQMLNEVAWTIVDPEGTVKTKNLDLAMRAAQGAVTISESKDGPILDTLARVHWLKGDKAKAIDVQRQAVAAVDAQEKQAKAELEKRLPKRLTEKQREQYMASVESTFSEMRNQLQATLDEYSGGKN